MRAYGLATPNEPCDPKVTLPATPNSPFDAKTHTPAKR
jgi:hypothetical protein